MAAVTTTLDQLSSDLSLANGLDRDETLRLIGESARVRAALDARLMALATPASTVKGSPDDAMLLTAEQAARQLAVPLQWIYRHQQELGGVHLGEGTLRFPLEALDDFVARRGRKFQCARASNRNRILRGNQTQGG